MPPPRPTLHRPSPAAAGRAAATASSRAMKMAGPATLRHLRTALRRADRDALTRAITDVLFIGAARRRHLRPSGASPVLDAASHERRPGTWPTSSTAR